MNSQLFFLTVFLVCYVHSYRSESERSGPTYEPAMDEIQDKVESMEKPSVKREDRETTGPPIGNSEYSQPEEGFEQKPNKKDKHSEHTIDKKGYKNGKKSAQNEGGAENVYDKEFKEIKHKKSKGKVFNKKYNGHNFEQKANFEEGVDFAADEQPSHEAPHKRFTTSSKTTDSEAGPQERVERSAKFEEEPLPEEQPQVKTKYQNKDKNRKNDMKSGKYGKNGKYSKKNSKNSSKRQKREKGYFGFWA